MRDGCSNRKYGYVMDTSTRAPLQHIQNGWIHILGNLSRCRNQGFQDLRIWTSLPELKNSRSQEPKISKLTNLNEYPDLDTRVIKFVGRCSIFANRILGQLMGAMLPNRQQHWVGRKPLAAVTSTDGTAGAI